MPRGKQEWLKGQKVNSARKSRKIIVIYFNREDVNKMLRLLIIFPYVLSYFLLLYFVGKAIKSQVLDLNFVSMVCLVISIRRNDKCFIGTIHFSMPL